MVLNPLDENRLLGQIDLTTKQKNLQLGILSLILLFVFGWLFISLAKLFRGYDLLEVAVVRFSGAGYDVSLVLLVIGLLLAVLVAMACLHEALHGLLMWALTGEKPRFGFKVHPYAALPPGTYASRNGGILISLGPLVTITVFGIPVLVVFPLSFLWLPIMFLSFNAAASVGDVFIAVWLLRFRKSAVWGAQGTSNVVFTNPRSKT